MKALNAPLLLLAVVIGVVGQSENPPVQKGCGESLKANSGFVCDRNKDITSSMFSLAEKGITRAALNAILASEGCESGGYNEGDGAGNTVKVTNVNWIAQNGDALSTVFRDDILEGATVWPVKADASTDKNVRTEVAINEPADGGVDDRGKRGRADAIPSADASNVRKGYLYSDENIDYLGRFDQLKIGMRYSDVVGIIGAPGLKQLFTTTDGKDYVSYHWEGEDIFRIYIMFLDNRLVVKHQIGLSEASDSNSAEIDISKYNKILSGMSLFQVEIIIGSKGEQTSSAFVDGCSSKSYRWKGEKFSFISVRFYEDKVHSKSQYGLK